MLVHRVIAHLQYLFEIKSMSGLFPKINELYVFVNEMQNFLRAVCDALDLPASAPPATILRRLGELTEAQALAV